MEIEKWHASISIIETNVTYFAKEPISIDSSCDMGLRTLELSAFLIALRINYLMIPENECL